MFEFIGQLWGAIVGGISQIGPWIDHLLRHHSYLAYPILFVGTFLEGETILIIVAALARIAATSHHPQAHPDLFLSMLSAFAGSLAGDQTWFMIGRRKGKAVLAKHPLWQSRAERVYRILERHQNWLMLSFRFLYGLRNVTPFVIGMSPIKTSRFVIFNIIGAAIWAVSFAMAGYLIGVQVEQMIKRYKFLVLAGVGLLIAIIWLIRLYIRRRRAMKAIAAETRKASDDQNTPSQSGNGE